ncbi:chymotrypsin-like protease-2, partial [Aphelenchoides avenae]
VAKIFHGQPVEPGKYPWAVAITNQLGTWCAGTLISKRHIVTARHCFKENGLLENAPYWYLKVFAGGVCHRKGKDCPSSDMRELEWDFAAYELEPPGEDNSPVFKEHDIAIIQLKEDVPENDTSIRPVCLVPPGAALKEQLNVYGWGMKEGKRLGKFFYVLPM